MAAAVSTPDAAHAHPVLVERWRDPVVFAWEVLGIWCWSKQREMLRLMAANPNVAVRSGQKCSKSLTIVIFSLWWLLMKPGAKVFVTSSDYRNISTVFWNELKGVLRQSRVAIGGHCAETPMGGFQLEDGRFIKGFSTDKIEGWGGFSGPSMLFLIDEASRIEQPIFEAIDGNRAGGGHLAMVGNPTQNIGPFFDAFHAQRDHWATMAISSTQTPNCTGEKVQLRTGPATWKWTNRVPGLADPAQLKERARRYGGEDHPFYLVRVLGDFSRDTDDSIVPLGLVEAAQQRYKIRGKDYVGGEGRLVLGVDPARYGTDATAIAVRRGRRIYRVATLHKANTQKICAMVKELIDHYNGPSNNPQNRAKRGTQTPLVNVDVTGGYGVGVVDMLPEMRAELGGKLCEVGEVNASERSDDDDAFNNMRTQLLFGVREWLEGGQCALPWTAITQVEDDQLAADLIATKFSFDARGRRKAQSKDEVRDILGRSPDRGDAIALSCYMGTDVEDRGGPGGSGAVGYDQGGGSGNNEGVFSYGGGG
jgi:hypothetical protein